MPHRIEDWLNSDPTAIDYYQMVDLPRFHPDQAALLNAFASAEQVLAALLDAPIEASRHDAARRWQNAIQQATRTFSDSQAWQAYDAALRSKLSDLYSIEAASESAAWQESHVRHWLERSQHVSSQRIDEVVSEFLRAVPGASLGSKDRESPRDGLPRTAPRGAPLPHIRKLPGSAGIPSAAIQPTNPRAALPPPLPGVAVPTGRLIPQPTPGGFRGGRGPSVRRPVPLAAQQVSDRNLASSNGTAFLWLLGSAVVTALVVGSIGTVILVMQNRDGHAIVTHHRAKVAPDGRPPVGAGKGSQSSSAQSTDSDSAAGESNGATTDRPSKKDTPSDPKEDAPKSTPNDQPATPEPAKPEPGDAPKGSKESPDLPPAVEQRIKAHLGPIRATAWNRDGARVATAGDGPIVRIWNAADGARLHEPKGSTRTITALAWSVDDKNLLAGAADNGTVFIWDAESGSASHTLRTSGASVTALLWDNEGGRLLTGDDAGRVSVWDVPSEKESKVAERHQGAGAIQGLCRFSEAASPLKAISGQADGSLIVWGSSGAKLEPLQLILPNRGKLWDDLVAADPSDNAMTDDEADESAKSTGRRPTSKNKSPLRNQAKNKDVSIAEKARKLHATPSLNESCLSVAAWPHEQLVAVATGNVEIWDLRKREVGVRVRTLPPHPSKHGYRLVAWNHEGNFLAATDDRGLLQVWETQQWKVIVSQKLDSVINALAWQPTTPARLAVATTDGKLSIIAVVVPQEDAAPTPPFDLGDFIKTATELTTDDEWGEVSRAVALLESYQPLPAGHTPAFETLRKTLDRAAQSQLDELEKSFTSEAGSRAQRRGKPKARGANEMITRDFVDWILIWQGLIDLAPDSPAARKARQRLEELATGG